MLHFKGKSLFNSKPIISILAGVTEPSRNRKTGAVIQQYILLDDVKPTELSLEQSQSICGACPLQPKLGGGCYVLRHQDSLAVFKSGSRKHLDERLIQGRPVRLGADGDPTAIPFEEYEILIKNAGLILGYTHNWRECDIRWQKILKASVETEQDYEEAKDLGWHTFRIRPTKESPAKAKETVCLYESDLRQCISCRLCSKPMDIVVTAHGSRKSKIKFN